ncbi:Connectin [Gryllus bimaculatus]|nr:Connectin [Gryllus bimaculatus]
MSMRRGQCAVAWVGVAWAEGSAHGPADYLNYLDVDFRMSKSILRIHIEIDKEIRVLGSLTTTLNEYKYEEVSLTRNKIHSLAPRALARLPQLEQLNLDENRLAELRRDSLQLPQLRRLYMARNNLSLLQERALSQLPRLEELELNHNQISVVTRETFAGVGGSGGGWWLWCGMMAVLEVKVVVVVGRVVEEDAVVVVVVMVKMMWKWYGSGGDGEGHGRGRGVGEGSGDDADRGGSGRMVKVMEGVTMMERKWIWR